MEYKWATTEWTSTGRISTGFIYFQMSNSNLHALQSSPLYKIPDSSYTHSSTSMDMQIKRVAFCLATQSTTLVSRHKVSFSPNIYPQFVSMWNSSPVISAKNKCPPKIKVKTCRNKVVRESLSISGPIRLIAILYKLACLRM